MLPSQLGKPVRSREEEKLVWPQTSKEHMQSPGHRGRGEELRRGVSCSFTDPEGLSQSAL